MRIRHAPGMENHVGPFGDDSGVIVKRTSDAMFGPDGLGFAQSPWLTLVSWLARDGISEQTGSKPNETIVENCVVGWGQGAYSSHVFRPGGSADTVRLDSLIQHLQAIATRLEGDPACIGSKTVAAFVGAQHAQPYSTVTGTREARGFVARLKARFRGHIQWQSLVALCGQVNGEGRRVVTPSLLRAFFGGEGSFFAGLVERRRALRSGTLKPGEPVGMLTDVEPGIDRVATDRRYMANKSALWVILKIAFYMVTRRGARLDPL